MVKEKQHIDPLFRDLEREIDWLAQLLDHRFKDYFNLETQFERLEEIEPPILENANTTYARMVTFYQLGFAERAAMALCLARPLRPQLLDVFFTKNKTFNRAFTEFGGRVLNARSGFLPTGETLLFLLAGSNIHRRTALFPLLEPEHPLFSQRLLELDTPQHAAAPYSGLLHLSQESRANWLLGRTYRPRFGFQFPAQSLTTELEWVDLVLPEYTQEELREILAWSQHGQTLLDDWGMRRQLRPGYRSLFYGPPGTGKTMTASLLGKTTGRDVYRIDLSMVISKYIGETEKNLARVFNQAENRGWILFFDEADALFGKRTEISDAHDRYANQEVSYLLQRIELFDGITILASNLRTNLDDAFTRRFESIIYFPVPGPEERLRIWQQSIPKAANLEDGLNLPAIARKYELTGGGIVNTIRYAALQAIDRGDQRITQRDLLQGIRREYRKEGKSFSG